MAMTEAQTGLRATGAEDAGVLTGVVMTAEASTEVAEEAHPPVWGKCAQPRRYYCTRMKNMLFDLKAVDKILILTYC